ncbi:MAG: hypothetical protein HY553_22110 [Elusimicrobia bacterium]|nr:hypothetical protein [Elusimicrobiota bacterium]
MKSIAFSLVAGAAFAAQAAAQTKVVSVVGRTAAPVVLVSPQAANVPAWARSPLAPATAAAGRVRAPAAGIRLSAPIETWRELAAFVARRAEGAAASTDDKSIFVVAMNETFESVRRDGFRDSAGRLLTGLESAPFIDAGWRLLGTADQVFADYASFSAQVTGQLRRLSAWSKDLKSLPELLSAFDRLIDESGPGLPKPPRPEPASALKASAELRRAVRRTASATELAGALGDPLSERRKKP